MIFASFNWCLTFTGTGILLFVIWASLNAFSVSSEDLAIISACLHRDSDTFLPSCRSGVSEIVFWACFFASSAIIKPINLCIYTWICGGFAGASYISIGNIEFWAGVMA